MYVSASSEDELQLSSARKNETSAPVFFSPMHKLLQRNPVCVFDGGTSDLFYSIFSWRTLCFWRQSASTTWAVSSTVLSCTFTNVQKQHYSFRTEDRSAADKEKQNKKTLSDTTEPRIKDIRSQLITFSRSINVPLFFVECRIMTKEAPCH